jgi:hypothetical protein
VRRFLPSSCPHPLPSSAALIAALIRAIRARSLHRSLHRSALIHCTHRCLIPRHRISAPALSCSALRSALHRLLDARRCVRRLASALLGAGLARFSIDCIDA